MPLVEQLWQRLMPRANAESSPAARRLADDAKRVASKLPLSAVRPMGLTAAGGAERCRIEDGGCLATFVDPATGEPRVACDTGYPNYDVSIYDPVAGGAVLVVLDVGSRVDALAVFGVLLFLLSFPDIFDRQGFVPAVCASVVDRAVPLDEGYGLILASFSGLDF